MLWARQRQERVQHVKNAIVSAVHKYTQLEPTE